MKSARKPRSMRLFETVETMADGSSPPANKRFPALLADAITTGMNAVDKTKYMPPVQLAVDMAWADHRTVLKGNFNGAEAMRRAVGHTFVHDLLTYVEANPPKKKPRTLLGYLLKLLRTSSFYEARFLEKPKPIPGFGTTVLRPEIAGLPVVTQFPLRLQLRRAFWNAIQPLYAYNDPNARFIPTARPIRFRFRSLQPSTVAGSTTSGSISTALPWPSSAPIREPPHLTNGTTQISPILAGPATSTSRAPTCWVRSSDVAGGKRWPQSHVHRVPGFPFADRALEAHIANDAQPSVEMQRPFYRHDPHALLAVNDFARVPRIAHGRSFKTFSFVTSNAGTLPLALQRAPTSPSMPALEPSVPGPDKLPPLKIVFNEDPQSQSCGL